MCNFICHVCTGLAEITRLAVAKGANPLTMGGLAGMGDLVLTCTGEACAVVHTQHTQLCRPVQKLTCSPLYVVFLGSPFDLL